MADRVPLDVFRDHLEEPPPSEHLPQVIVDRPIRIKARGWLLVTPPPAYDEPLVAGGPSTRSVYRQAWTALTGRDEDWSGCASQEQVERIADALLAMLRQGIAEGRRAGGPS